MIVKKPDSGAEALAQLGRIETDIGELRRRLSKVELPDRPPAPREVELAWNDFVHAFNMDMQEFQKRTGLVIRTLIISGGAHARAITITPTFGL